MLRKVFLVPCLAVALTGCEVTMFGNIMGSCALRPTPKILPASLPSATVGQPYNAHLKVIDIPSPVHGIYLSEEFHLPEGLRVEHESRDSHALITGTPTKAGSYEVHMSASTYNTQCVGLEANRIYTLEVTE